MSTTTEMKRLQTRLKDLQDELKQAEQERSVADQKTRTLRGKIKGVEKSIQRLTQKEIVVTEHAMLRYIERVLKLDLEEVRKRILSPKVRGYIDELGSGKFPQNGEETNKYRVVVKNRVVTTIED